MSKCYWNAIDRAIAKHGGEKDTRLEFLLETVFQSGVFPALRILEQSSDFPIREIDPPQIIDRPEKKNDILHEADRTEHEARLEERVATKESKD